MHNPFQTSSRQYFTGFAIFILLIFYKGINILVNWNTPSHFSDAGDALPAAEDPRFSPKTRSIFFHETSFRGGLTARQACSVEAAARAHPLWQIYVLFSSPVTDHALKTSCLSKLLQFHNVKFLRVHVAEYSKGTVLQSILLNNMKESKHPIQHAADILRILTLNKWGGIYLDTDMIVTRSLEQLPSNFVAKQNHLLIASGILAFAKDEIGTNVTNAIINQIFQYFNPKAWAANGPDAIHAVIKRICPKVIKSAKYKSKPINNCKGIFIFGCDLFYPYYYNDLAVIFSNTEKNIDLDRPYTYHMWNHLSSMRDIHKDTIYDMVAKKFCPTIHGIYPDEFARGEIEKKVEQSYEVEYYDDSSSSSSSFS